MDEAAFKARTKQLALRVIRMVATLPKDKAADVMGRQILRPATAVGANYRAACRAKSTADMIAKLSIVEEEADETLYWLELFVESGLISESLLSSLIQETSEIVAMVVSSIKTLRQNQRQDQTLAPKSKI
ncbi:MAG TPA: four helix bundle protein [Anaerolineae bacterium]|nr:four helix bundle protein [Anaerolineae bacterium]